MAEGAFRSSRNDDEAEAIATLAIYRMSADFIRGLRLGGEGGSDPPWEVVDVGRRLKEHLAAALGLTRGATAEAVGLRVDRLTEVGALPARVDLRRRWDFPLLPARGRSRA